MLKAGYMVHVKAVLYAVCDTSHRTLHRPRLDTPRLDTPSPRPLLDTHYVMCASTLRIDYTRSNTTLVPKVYSALTLKCYVLTIHYLMQSLLCTYSRQCDRTDGLTRRLRKCQ